ncbi:MAG: hypothetical protein U0703_10935 [Anaerolineae bacterium]
MTVIATGFEHSSRVQRKMDQQTIYRQPQQQQPVQRQQPAATTAASDAAVQRASRPPIRR